MKVNKDFVVSEILGNCVLINVQKKFKSIMKLNKTAKEVYDLLLEDKTIDEIINFLNNKYNVDKTIIEKDVNEVINKMLIKGILIDE